MALTENEKLKVLRHLGWPAKTIDSTSLSYSKMVADRLDGVSAAMESEVRDYLEKFTTLENRLTKALSRAGVKSIDDITFNGEEMDVLRREKRRLANELGLVLDIHVNSLPGGSMGAVIV